MWFLIAFGYFDVFDCPGCFLSLLINVVLFLADLDCFVGFALLLMAFDCVPLSWFILAGLVCMWLFVDCFNLRLVVVECRWVLLVVSNLFDLFLVSLDWFDRVWYSYCVVLCWLRLSCFLLMLLFGCVCLRVVAFDRCWVPLVALIDLICSNFIDGWECLCFFYVFDCFVWGIALDWLQLLLSMFDWCVRLGSICLFLVVSDCVWLVSHVFVCFVSFHILFGCVWLLLFAIDRLWLYLLVIVGLGLCLIACDCFCLFLVVCWLFWLCSVFVSLILTC